MLENTKVGDTLVISPENNSTGYYSKWYPYRFATVTKVDRVKVTTTDFRGIERIFNVSNGKTRGERSHYFYPNVVDISVNDAVESNMETATHNLWVDSVRFLSTVEWKDAVSKDFSINLAKLVSLEMKHKEKEQEENGE